MITPIFKSKVIDGELLIHETMRNWIAKMPEDVEVIVRPFRRSRSNPQNAYYHSVLVTIIREELGESHDDMHDILKSKFLTKWVILETKEGLEEIQIVRSTTSLSTVEFESFTSQIREWASMYLGLFLPAPNEADLS